MTTAELRKAAAKAEANLRWGEAAHFWRQAAEAYPTTRGALAERDIDRMIAAARACERQAIREAGLR